jgi:hypothetical protein
VWAQDAAKTQSEAAAALRAAGPAAPLGICPVQLMGGVNRNVAEALALVLEKQGMDQLVIAEAFTPPAGAAWETVPAAFGEFVRKLPEGPPFVLFAEFVGEPRTGPQEVRFVVVSKAGEVVLEDRQTPQDADFKRTAGADPDPMGCSVLVAERLFSRTGWSKRSVPDGKFARLWAEKSGTPDDAQRQAMQKRCQQLKSNLSAARLGVLPTLVNNAADAGSGTRLADLTAQKLACKAQADPQAAGLKIEPTSNEQKRLWDLARQVREHVRAHPPESDYVLQAEYLLAPGGAAHSVHFVLCDRTGEWVLVDFQNNQHPDFKQINPQSVADCERLTVERLGRLLK